jgi:glycosyltransferase involved in cell wall biosynthesis
MSKPIRVLQVFANLNRGGAETMIMNSYRNIDRNKVQYDFVVHSDDKSDYEEEIKSLGGKIYRISRYNGKNHFAYKKEWENFFSQHPEYKIVHGHIRSTASIYLKIARKFGRKTIVHSHSTSSGSGSAAFVKNIMQFPIRHIADYLFACSKDAGIWLYGKMACEQDNFYILKNAIEAKKYIFNPITRDKKRKELQVSDKFVIGHVGRFYEVKNHDFIIKLFKNLHDKDNSLVLLLVGGGDLKPTIEAQVKELGLSNNVIFTGLREDIPDLLQAMDVFLFPSIYEGLGIAAIEAQASGLPTIVSETIPREAYVTDLIEKEYLASPLSAWIDKILVYTKGYERRNTYKEIIEAGYDVIESAKWLENFYLKLMD